jgi:alpha-galactosidase
MLYYMPQTWTSDDTDAVERPFAWMLTIRKGLIPIGSETLIVIKI